jgi:hypothetical protein
MLCWWWLWAMEVESWWKKMAGVCLLIKGQSIGCRCVERNAGNGRQAAWLEYEHGVGGATIVGAHAPSIAAKIGAHVSGGAAKVLPLMARGERPLSRFHAGPRCMRANTGGHYCYPRQRIGFPNLRCGCVGVNKLIRLHRPARTCAGCPPVQADRYRLPRTVWIYPLEMP